MKKFKSKSDLFAYLVENKEDIIFQKKSATKFADCVLHLPLKIKETAEKAQRYDYSNDEQAGKLTRTIVLNTYNWLDSHDDVHLNGIFSKSISETRRKFHLHDHQQSLEGRVGIPQEFSEKEISWRELGQGKTGKTQALFMKSEIRKDLNEKMYQAYLNDEIDQHSVGMQYVKMALAINDEEKYPNEFKVWQEHIGKLGNRGTAEEQGFFWAVSEAKLYEGSAVLFGANELTPTLGSKSQPEKSTVTAEEPVISTRVLEALKGFNKKF